MTPTKNSSTSTLKFSGFFETLLGFFSKSGPWAVLSLLMIVGLGYEAHLVVTGAGTEVTKFVLATSKNVDALGDAVHKLEDAQTTTMSAMSTLQNSVARNGEQVAINQDQLKKVLEQSQLVLQKINDSYEMMKDVPGQREAMLQQSTEQIALLQEIRTAIQSLTDEVRNTPLITTEGVGEEE